MTFFDAFTAVKAAFKPTKAKKVAGHLAIQVHLTDPDASGDFYVEVDEGKLRVEPYDYHDRDALFRVSSRDLIRILDAKLSLEQALESQRLVVEGDLERAMEFGKLVRTVSGKPRSPKTCK